jgi:hypothetical protein
LIFVLTRHGAILSEDSRRVNGLFRMFCLPPGEVLASVEAANARTDNQEVPACLLPNKSSFGQKNAFE